MMDTADNVYSHSYTATDTSTTSCTTWSSWTSAEYNVAVRDRWITWVSDSTADTNNYAGSYELAERNEEALKELEEKVKAEERARKLLKDLIGEEQLKIYEKTGRVFVKGNKADYIIQKDNFIKQITKGTVVDLCVHLDNKHKYPETDNVIALKLALEMNEDEIIGMANQHGVNAFDGELPECACL
mgnify:CR=1 FL=1